MKGDGWSPTERCSRLHLCGRHDEAPSRYQRMFSGLDQDIHQLPDRSGGAAWGHCTSMGFYCGSEDLILEQHLDHLMRLPASETAEQSKTEPERLESTVS